MTSDPREQKLLNMYKPTESEGNKLVLLVDDETVSFLDYLHVPTMVTVNNEYGLVSGLLEKVCTQLSYDTIVIIGENGDVTTLGNKGGDDEETL